MSRANGIGVKGGTSATAGKKSSKFAFTAPDGREMTARVFKVQGDGPFVALFYQGSEGAGDAWWYNTVVAADDPREWVARYDLPRHAKVPATKV